MANLLEIFEQHEQKFSAVGGRDLHKLKYISDIRSGDNPKQMQFELQSLFRLIDALEPREMRVQIDETYKRIEKLEFNPTISGPNIVLKDNLRRWLCFWYKPLFYIPTPNSARQLMVDFAVFKGVSGSMYNLDPELKKQLYAYEFLSNNLLREITIKMLSKLKQPSLLIQCRQCFTPSHLTDIKAMDYFLKPQKILLVSEEYLPNDVKLNLPFNVQYVENVDMSAQKFVEAAKRLL